MSINSISRREYLVGSTVVGLGGIYGVRNLIGRNAGYPGRREISDVKFEVENYSSLQGEAEAKNSQISKNSTASIGLNFVWEGDSKKTFEFGTNEIPFDYPTANQGSPDRILLVPESASNEIKRRNNNAWVPESLDELSAYLPLENYTFNPGEKATWTWQIWGHPREVDYIPSGKYIFKNYEGAHKQSVKVSLSMKINDL